MNDIAIVEMDDFTKQRVGVLCLPGLESFLGDIVGHLKKTYSVRTYYGNSMAEIEKVVNWADILFLEWMNEMAINVTKLPVLKDKQVLIRCHSYEALAPYVQQITWSSVSAIIFVASHIRDIVLKSIPKLPEMVEVFVVPNGV